MRGLYLNCKIDNVQHLVDYFSTQNVIFEDEFLGHQITIIQSKQEVLDSHCITLADGARLYIYGWFILNGQRNPVHELAEAYQAIGVQALEAIEMGNFILAQISASGIKVYNDLFGVSSHYFASNDHERLSLAPTVKALDVSLEKDPLLWDFLQRQTNLFSEYTAYKNVYRLLPASMVDQAGQMTVCRHIPVDEHVPQEGLQKINADLAQLVSYWEPSSRCLAISGGLDSRLILASSEFNYGYTYGPENSGDRKIAAPYAQEFKRYHAFEYIRDEKLEKQHDKLLEAMFEGVTVCAKGLFANYEHVSKLSGQANIFFDGYLGDVLQRGTFIKFTGILGHILKLLPLGYRLNISAKYILRKRYTAVTHAQFEQLWCDFKKKTEHIAHLTDYQKVTYYEFVYARAPRNVLNGCGVMAGQFYSTVPVFTYLPIFSALMACDFRKVVAYAYMGDIWRNLPDKYKLRLADSGISPMTPGWRAPLQHVIYRFLNRYTPFFKDYTKA